MSNIDKQIDKALDSLLGKPGLSDDLSRMCARVKELEIKLKNIEFLHREGVQILVHADDVHSIGYDFIKKRIICSVIESDNVLRKPFAEHKWPVRQKMFFEIPRLLEVLEEIK